MRNSLSPSRADIAGAVPPGSRRARSQGQFLAEFALEPDLDLVRADFRRSIQECVRVWARYASWADRTTRPTRALVCRLVGSSRNPDKPLSITTYKDVRGWLEDRGWLGTVEEGTTPWFNGLADPDARNTAATYVLCIPRRKHRTPLPDPQRPVNRPPSGSPRGDPERIPARASQKDQERGPRSARRPSSVRWRAAARDKPVKRLTDRHVAWIARPYKAAGWSDDDVGWAADHDPAGAQWRTRLDRVKNPGAWLRWRLARHLDPDTGEPLPSHSQVLAAANEQLLAGQAADAAAAATRAAAAVDPAPRAAAIRAQFGWRKR